MNPLIIPRSQHPISRSMIDEEPLKVLYRLHRHGYLACLVGGSVRDQALMSSVYAGRTLINQDPYCLEYLKAYREKKILI